MSSVAKINAGTPFLEGVSNSLVSRDWYRFLASVSAMLGGGSTVLSPDDISILGVISDPSAAGVAEALKDLSDAYNLIAMSVAENAAFAELQKQVADLQVQMSIIAAPFNSVAVASGQTFGGPISGGPQAPAFRITRYAKRKTSTTTITTNTVLANDTELLIPIGANEEWIGRTSISLGDGLKTTGIKIAITAPAGATGFYNATLVTDATIAQESDVLEAASPGTTLDFTAAILGAGAGLGFMEVTWNMINGATPGNVTMQFAQSTSSATALLIKQGSQMIADRVA